MVEDCQGVSQLHLGECGTGFYEHASKFWERLRGLNCPPSSAHDTLTDTVVFSADCFGFSSVDAGAGESMVVVSIGAGSSGSSSLCCNKEDIWG